MAKSKAAKVSSSVDRNQYIAPQIKSATSIPAVPEGERGVIKIANLEGLRYVTASEGLPTRYLISPESFDLVQATVCFHGEGDVLPRHQWDVAKALDSFDRPDALPQVDNTILASVKLSEKGEKNSVLCELTFVKCGAFHGGTDLCDPAGVLRGLCKTLERNWKLMLQPDEKCIVTGMALVSLPLRSLDKIKSLEKTAELIIKECNSSAGHMDCDDEEGLAIASEQVRRHMEAHVKEVILRGPALRCREDHFIIGRGIKNNKTED